MQSTIKNRTIFCRDNLEILRGVDSGTIDLIYLDPPFNSKKQWDAPIGGDAAGASFKDIWRAEDVKDEDVGLLAEKHPKIAKYIKGIKDVGHRSNWCYLAI